MEKCRRSRWRATSSSSPGSQIGIRPARRASILASSMSMHQTSLPSSAKPAAVTRPTYPVPITPMGSLLALLMPGGPAYCLSRRREEAISIIWASPIWCVSVFETQYTPRLVFHATRRSARPS